jgi:hypothetical protein
MIDTPQDKLSRMASHFEDEGIYTKANYCLEIIDYINQLEKFQNDAFEAYPNIDLDIEKLG